MTDNTTRRPVPSEDARADHDPTSPSNLMRTLQEDVQQVRVGNGAPESVPVFQSREDPSVRYVRFSDLSSNVRHILDVCREVDVHVNGRRTEGARNWREVGGRRGPVLEWHADKRKST